MPERSDDAVEEAVRLVNEARGSSWYEEHNAVDAALATLCMLRRDEADVRRSAEGGDNLVRQVLERAEPEALVWLASRTISYVDENGLPDLPQYRATAG